VVGHHRRNILAAGCAVLAVGTLGCTGAAAVGFEDIAGTWCTAGGSETFDRADLTAIASTGDKRVFAIVHYEFTETQATVTWTNAVGETVHTDFTGFSLDGRHMVQRASEDGPQREFHRC
jgi:hypothetical protein